MRAWAYDLLYRTWAPWNAVGVRADLRALVESGRISPRTHPRVVDLGCGSGANATYLAEQGHEVVGVDFSPVALAKATRRAERAGVELRLVRADLTATVLPGVEGPFDLVLDFGALDDLTPDGRQAMAAHIQRLVRSGGFFVFWCFYADPGTLPRFSFTGPSRVVPVIRPGEEHELFDAAFTMAELSRGDRSACFLLTRRP